MVESINVIITIYVFPLVIIYNDVDDSSSNNVEDGNKNYPWLIHDLHDPMTLLLRWNTNFKRLLSFWVMELSVY